MARCTIVIDAPVERVFETLSDPEPYAYWVVGSDAIRGADEDFPAKGTRFYHRVGSGPMKVEDYTQVLDVNPPYYLELRAKARPAGVARVILLLSPRSEQSAFVTIIEKPDSRLTRLLFNPLTNVLVVARNAASLRRLKRLVEGRARDGSGGP